MSLKKLILYLELVLTVIKNYKISITEISNRENKESNTDGYNDLYNYLMIIIKIKI